MHHRIIFNKYRLSIFIVILFFGILHAQTGKIRGRVIEAESGEPLPGVNVVVKGPSLGAATDQSGNFLIVNVPPGQYNIVFSMIGYQKYMLTDVNVSINRTTTVDAELKQGTLKGETIVVEAKEIKIKKDQTSTIKNIGSDEISSLPVEDIDQVIGMQAGVVQGHFRGGRNTEVTYLIDGMQVNESFGGTSKMVEIDPDAVQDLEVITGIFNAEYGQAMSGVVNMVPKEGGSQFEGKISSKFSNYMTFDNQLYKGISPFNISRNQDVSLMLEGPIYKDKVTFFTNIRYYRDNGYLNGRRIFNDHDYSNFSIPYKVTGEHPDSPWAVYTYELDYYRYKKYYENYSFEEYKQMIMERKEKQGEPLDPIYYSEKTGDSSYVPMNWNNRINFLGRLTMRPTSNLKVNFTSIINDNTSQNYSFWRRFQPDSRPTNYSDSYSNMLSLNYMITDKMYYILKASYNYDQYENYLYKDPTDERYLNGNYGSQSYGYYERISANYNLNYDFVWQINENHGLKAGFDGIYHKIKNNPVPVWNKYRYNPNYTDSIYYDEQEEEVYFDNDYWELVELPDSAYSKDQYTKHPYQFSGYIQDKMEFQDLIMNIGIRYDYFNANTTYPTNYRNPSNDIYFVDSLREERYSEFPESKPQIQISPRFGLSYSLGETAALHFGYGHFFQTPPLENLYRNSRHLIPENDYATVLGNPNLKAEKTVQYEFGLQQQIIPGMVLDMAVYYSDVYNLRTVVVKQTYNKTKYGLFDNKDYANKKGLELKLNYIKDYYSLDINYTLQYTRANADNPAQTYNAAGQNVDPVPRLIPTAWDQRHTFNISAGYRRENYGINFTGYYNSGTRYTWSPFAESRLAKLRLYPNNAKEPYTLKFDMRAHYNIKLMKNYGLQFTLAVFNLFDRRNVTYVNPTTGLPNTIIVEEESIRNYRSDFLPYEETYKYNPTAYTAPRKVKLGLEITF